MAINQIDFRNSLATLGLSALSCRNFEDDAYGAMLGLIHFRRLTPHARHLWDLATMKSMQQPGMGEWSFRHSFFWQLRQLRLQVFFTGTDTKSVNGPNVGDYPWCLNAREFDYCYQSVKAGRISRPPNIADEGVLSGFGISSNDVFLGGLAFSIASKFISKFLQKAAPDLVEGVSGITDGLPVIVGGAILEFLTHIAKAAELKSLQNRYRIDLIRRKSIKDYLPNIYSMN